MRGLLLISFLSCLCFSSAISMKKENKATIIANAVRRNENADFIKNLIKDKADVNLKFNNTIYSLAITLASLHGNHKTLSEIIKAGGLEGILKDKEGDKGASLLIRFIREAKESDESELENYGICLQHLIKAGCAVQQEKVCKLGVEAYINLSGLPAVFYDFSPEFEDEFTTPLIEAVRLNMLTFVKLLMQTGADPDKKYNGTSARDIAQKIAEKKSVLQTILSWFGKNEEENKKKNSIELAINEIETDQIRALEKICEKERLKQEKAEFEEENRHFSFLV